MGSLADAIDRMARAVEGTMLPTMLDIGLEVETGAKSGHPWRNRTGRLERNIKHGAASGSLRRGYTVTVTAKTHYASYLEDGREVTRGDWHRDSGGNEISMGSSVVGISHWAFLMPAWERVEEQSAALVATNIANAITRS